MAVHPLHRLRSHKRQSAREHLVEGDAERWIDNFPVGEHDTPDRLLIPEKLYGRAREIETLLAAFDRVVRSGTPELVLVSGYSGIGKSSVVHELHRMLVPPRGLFASGKFHASQRGLSNRWCGHTVATLRGAVYFNFLEDLSFYGHSHAPRGGSRRCGRSPTSSGRRAPWRSSSETRLRSRRLGRRSWWPRIRRRLRLGWHLPYPREQQGQKIPP
jgi:hypothetical protein